MEFDQEYVMEDIIYPVENDDKEDNLNIQFIIYCDGIVFNGTNLNAGNNAFT